MKKYILITTAIILSSCTANEASKTDSASTKDCGCDRIVEVSSFTLADHSVFGRYVTINDCTGVQRSYDWGGTAPKKGSCR